jgi:hypothetical protein
MQSAGPAALHFASFPAKQFMIKVNLFSDLADVHPHSADGAWLAKGQGDAKRRRPVPLNSFFAVESKWDW